jgi:hypothetical protein
VLIAALLGGLLAELSEGSRRLRPSVTEALALQIGGLSVQGRLELLESVAVAPTPAPRIGDVAHLVGLRELC